MSFNVVLRQRPEGQAAQLVTVPEMSSDSLQLKLIKDMENVMSINGAFVTKAQKEQLRKAGRHWQIIDVQPEDQSLLVTARRDGFIRTWSLDPAGQGRFVDGHNQKMAIPLADPLTLT